MLPDPVGCASWVGLNFAFAEVVAKRSFAEVVTKKWLRNVLACARAICAGNCERERKSVLPASSHNNTVIGYRADPLGLINTRNRMQHVRIYVGQTTETKG